MPDPIMDQNQDQAQQPQLTLGDLSELHGIARQLQDAGDPRAARIWDLLSAQSGDGSAGPSFTIRQTSPQPSSWQDDLDNEIGGSEAAGASESSTADFLDNLSGIGFGAYMTMRDPDLPTYKDWRRQNFVRNGSGSYVSRDGEEYSNDDLKQIHGVLSRQAGNPLISSLFGPIPTAADYLVWRNQNYNNDHEVGGAWEDDDGGLYSEPALQEEFAAKAAAQNQDDQSKNAHDTEAESNPQQPGETEPQGNAGRDENDADSYSGTLAEAKSVPKLATTSAENSGEPNPEVPEGKQPAKQASQTVSKRSPTQDEIVSYIRQQADAYKIPQALALGLINKESHFDQSLKGADKEVGLCQILPLRDNEKHLDANGTQFQISLARAATDWQYNVRAGLSLLKEAYDFAQQNKPDDVIAATYARYNGQKNWKYYPVRNSPVHYHVYGRDVIKKGQKIHDNGYIDFYHQWGGK